MLNWIWLGMILVSLICGAFTGRLPQVAAAVTSEAKHAFEVALSLVGIMCFWLGLMRIAEDSGLVNALSHGIRPVMRRLFPEVPTDHPAMGAMMLNIAANMLGLNNAATPFGIKAMEALEELNPHPGTATNAMCTFLAINTSSVQVIPATAITYLAAAGGHDPTNIIVASFVATACSTVAALLAVKWLQRMKLFAVRFGGEST